MLIVKTGVVVHNHKSYGAGEPMPELTAVEQERLIKLNVCVSVGGTPAAQGDGQPGGDTGDKPASTPTGEIDLGLNAEAAIKAPKK